MAGERGLSLARAIREHVELVLRTVDGNITRAAKLLGIHRRTLQRMIDRWVNRDLL